MWQKRRRCMQPYMTLSADVLIVGGRKRRGDGGHPGQTDWTPGSGSSMFEKKATCKCSGCIARGMDAHEHRGRTRGPEKKTPELYVEANRAGGARASWTSRSAMPWPRRSWAVMQELMDWGVCFPVDEKGRVRSSLQIHSQGQVLRHHEGAGAEDDSGGEMRR